MKLVECPLRTDSWEAVASLFDPQVELAVDEEAG
jgi:hypothetical protein